VADLYYPPRAQRAATDASTARSHYHGAVDQIRQRAIPEPDRKRLLAELHAVHQRRMQEHAATWHSAFVDAEYRARKALVSDKTIRLSRITMDSYRSHLARLEGMSAKELDSEYTLARLMDDDVVMRAVAVAALNQRVPMQDPDGRITARDAASRLVTQFAWEQEPDGHGRLRLRFPEANGAWQTLQGLEAWTATDRMNATGVFSVPATPERPTDPTPVDPHEAARQAVAQLYPAAPNGQASGEPASTP
jgi:hypothetical protein